jgi:hypothetical protein
MISRSINPFLVELLHAWDSDTGVLSLADSEWRVVLEDAHAEGLTPLLYNWFRQTEVSSRPPADAADLLQQRFFAIAARNMMLADELAGILQAWERENRPCVPLRGLALAEDLFGDITLRPMGDIDLLVRREDLEDITSILCGLGFQQMDRRPGFAIDYYYTLKFFKDRHGWIIVEPHWTITYPPFADRVDMEVVWERSERDRVVGVASRKLAVEDLLFHLCLHLVHQGDEAPLLHFFEIDRLIRKRHESIDWSRVALMAEMSGQGFLLHRALDRVRTHFDTPVPEEAIKRIPDRPASKLEGRLADLLAGSENIDGKESLALLFTIKGMRARLRYVIALLFPSPEFMMIQYGLSHRRQLGLSYIRRLIYFTREGLKGVTRLLF